MATENGKKISPAYVGMSFFMKFINGLRETSIPPQIDRTVMPKASGSQISAVVNSLKFLQLLDSNSKPTETMRQFVNATDEARPALLKSILEGAYSFLFNDPEFDIENATGQMMAEKFRLQGVSGSTLSKGIVFFLAAAKVAGIKVSSHIKAPSVPATKRSPRKKGAVEEYEQDEEEADDEYGDGEKPGFVKIQIPLHGMPDGVVYLPDGLTAAQWAYALKITKFLLENYRNEDAPDTNIPGAS